MSKSRSNWTTPRGMATRFCVWRAYHRLYNRLGRPPSLAEISQVTGLPVSGYVSDILKSLKTCQDRLTHGDKPSHWDNGANIVSIDTYMAMNDRDH